MTKQDIHVTQEDIREAVLAGILDNEQAACFWTWFYCHDCMTFPRGKEIMAGVKRDFGRDISQAAAFRGRDMAKSLIFRVFFSRGATFHDLPLSALTDEENVC